MKLSKALTVIGFALTLSAGCHRNPDPQMPDPPGTPSPTPSAAALSTLTLSPTSVTGDGTSMGTVTLTAAAPVGDASISLSSSNVAASVPGSATVLAGATSQTFMITTFAPSADRTVTISASYAGVTRTADLLIRAVAVAPPLPPPAASVAGRWSGTLTPCASCPGTTVNIVVDIVQTGSNYTGQCTHGSGTPGALTGFHLVTTGSNYQDFLGACLSGSVDARFFPGDDYISWIWKSDYTARLTRH